MADLSLIGGILVIVLGGPAIFLVLGYLAMRGISTSLGVEDETQKELERKWAIADAAIEARKRGETFIPPADYDR